MEGIDYYNNTYYISVEGALYNHIIETMVVTRLVVNYIACDDYCVTVDLLEMKTIFEANIVISPLFGRTSTITIMP